MIDPSVSGNRRMRSAIRSTFDAAQRWKKSVVLALFDQGLVSIANFVQTIIAARVLPIEEFGKYVIVWALSLLVVSAATALIIDPLPAVTSSRRPTMRLPILTAAAQLSFLLGGVLALLIMIAGLVAEAWIGTFGVLLLCLAVSSPFQQVQMASRRFCYILRRQAVAAASAGAYAIVLVGGVIGLWASDRCTAPSLILLSGAASLAACAVGYARGCLPMSKTRSAIRKWLVRQCLRTGKWLAGSSVAGTASLSGFFAIAAAVAGPTATGIFRAQGILFMPVGQVTWAMASLLIPHMAEVGAKRPQKLRRAALVTIFGLGIMATAYSAGVLTLGSDLLDTLFHKPEVTAASRLLWPLAAYAILDAINTAISIALVANAATRSIFWGRAASIAFLLPGALFLGTVAGLDGLAWASMIANTVCATILAPALVNLFRSSGQAVLRR